MGNKAYFGEMNCMGDEVVLQRIGRVIIGVHTMESVETHNIFYLYMSSILEDVSNKRCFLS